VTGRVILAYDEARGPGGVGVDVANLARGLPAAHVEPLVARTTRHAIVRLLSSPDAVVHVFGCLPSSTAFRLLPLAKATRRPLVWTPIFHPSRPGSWRGYRLLRAMRLFDMLAPRTARFADAVVAATEAEAAFFAGLGARRVALIPPGVSDALPNDPKARLADLRTRLGLGLGPVILVVARANRRKGLPFAVASFTRLRNVRPDAQLLLVGPPDNHPAASTPGVRCLGWLALEEVERVYQAVDLLFVPSLYEGLPRVVIEAWRAGLPVVATDRVALAPTIDGLGGEIVRYGDPDAAARVLSHLLSEPATLRRYGAAGRRLVHERFLLPPLVRETADLYREVAAQQRHVPLIRRRRSPMN
jgi:glycosyltransferase involved in cell wall biosynthesis